MPISRTTRLKAGYVALLIVVAAAACGILWWTRGSTGSIIVLVVVLLIPGRLQGFIFRDLYRGRRLLAEGDYEESIRCSAGFLSQVRRSPWQKMLLWLTWSPYTTDVEAMALNNIGAAELERGGLAEAKAAFDEAVGLDPEYSVPYFNLALIAELGGDRDEAKRCLAKAAELGFANSRLDRLLSTAQVLMARVEGRGRASS